MTLQELQETFALIDSWEDRYAVIIDLGRRLEPLPEQAMTDENKVRGCMSQVWMLSSLSTDEPPRLTIRGDSDAHIVKGLIAVLILIYSGRTADEILATDLDQVFAQLQLDQHISVNRRNGVYAMVERIRSDARAAQAA